MLLVCLSVSGEPVATRSAGFSSGAVSRINPFLIDEKSINLGMTRPYPPGPPQARFHPPRSLVAPINRIGPSRTVKMGGLLLLV
jgi:hypothetical protein